MNAKILTIAFAFVAFMMVAGPVGAQTPPPDAAPAATAPAPADAAAPGPGDAGAAATTVENPYGLKALVTTGDFVSHGVLILLLIMSVGTWYIFFTKFIEQAKLLGQAKITEKKFWTAANLTEGIDKLGKNNVFRNVAERGQQAMARQGGMMSQADWCRCRCARGRRREFASWRRYLVPRLRGFDRTLRGTIRNGVGHSERVDRYRRCRPGLDRQGGWSCRRGADHDGARSSGRRASGALL